jgi:transcriptional regulator with XRE-family HTH domain
MAKRSPDEIDKVIGANLKTWRKKRGMSREELGGLMKAGMSPQAIGNYEEGTSQIAASGLVELAKLLGCTCADLFDGVAELLPAEVKVIVTPADARQQAAVKKLAKAIIIETTERMKP